MSYDFLSKLNQIEPLAPDRAVSAEQQQARAELCHEWDRTVAAGQVMKVNDR